MSINENQSAKKPDIGGQAVLDGVMMKAPDHIAVAVRKPDGDIVIKRDAYVSPAKKHKWMGLPMIRGAVNMVMMMRLGMEVLSSSGQMSGMLDEEPSRFEKWLAKKLGKGVDKVVMGVAMVLALALSVGLFVLLPNIPAKALRGAGWSLLSVNLISGLIRIVLLVGYLIFCGMIPEMKKTFQYHGAEHKTVYAHEAEVELTPENASTTHALALDMLHFSPEPRVVELVLDSARLLGQTDEISFYAVRYQAAFPEAYAHWLTKKAAK